MAHQFREERAFEVSDFGILFNYLRLVYLHFAPWRVERAVAAIGPYPSLQRALDALSRSDVLALRAQLEAVRVRDDDWFFAVLAPQVTALARPPVGAVTPRPGANGAVRQRARFASAPA